MKENDAAEWIFWNHQGIIPGPSETSEEFLLRGTYCSQLKGLMATKLKGAIPFSPEETLSEEILSAAFPKTEALYDIRPDWVPVFFSNYKLHPWHGGCAWIFQEEDGSPTAAFLQLRQSLRTAASYLGFYKRDELIAHELSHVGRMMFDEPKYEEILAYHSSSSPFRSYFGPLVQAPLESILFVFTLLLILAVDISSLASGISFFHWLKLLPLVLFSYAVFRLWKRQRNFRACHNSLKNLLGNVKNANAVIYRLTDAEIDLFASSSPEEIGFYVNADQSLRWQVIKNSYHSDKFLPQRHRGYLDSS